MFLMVEVVRSIGFLERYDISGKTAKELVDELMLDEALFPYVKMAIPVLKKRGKEKGIHLVYLVDEYELADEDYERWIRRISPKIPSRLDEGSGVLL